MADSGRVSPPRFGAGSGILASHSASNTNPAGSQNLGGTSRPASPLTADALAALNGNNVPPAANPNQSDVSESDSSETSALAGGNANAAMHAADARNGSELRALAGEPKSGRLEKFRSRFAKARNLAVRAARNPATIFSKPSREADGPIDPINVNDSTESGSDIDNKGMPPEKQADKYSSYRALRDLKLFEIQNPGIRGNNDFHKASKALFKFQKDHTKLGGSKLNDERKEPELQRLLEAACGCATKWSADKEIIGAVPEVALELLPPNPNASERTKKVILGARITAEKYVHNLPNPKESAATLHQWLCHEHQKFHCESLSQIVCQPSFPQSEGDANKQPTSPRNLPESQSALSTQVALWQAQDVLIQAQWRDEFAQCLPKENPAERFAKLPEYVRKAISNEAPLVAPQSLDKFNPPVIDAQNPPTLFGARKAALLTEANFQLERLHNHHKNLLESYDALAKAPRAGMIPAVIDATAKKIPDDTALKVRLVLAQDALITRATQTAEHIVAIEAHILSIRDLTSDTPADNAPLSNDVALSLSQCTEAKQANIQSQSTLDAAAINLERYGILDTLTVPEPKSAFPRHLVPGEVESAYWSVVHKEFLSVRNQLLEKDVALRKLENEFCANLSHAVDGNVHEKLLNNLVAIFDSEAKQLNHESTWENRSRGLHVVYPVINFQPESGLNVKGLIASYAKHRTATAKNLVDIHEARNTIEGNIVIQEALKFLHRNSRRDRNEAPIVDDLNFTIDGGPAIEAALRYVRTDSRAKGLVGIPSDEVLTLFLAIHLSNCKKLRARENSFDEVGRAIEIINDPKGSKPAPTDSFVPDHVNDLEIVSLHQQSIEDREAIAQLLIDFQLMVRLIKGPHTAVDISSGNGSTSSKGAGRGSRLPPKVGLAPRKKPSRNKVNSEKLEPATGEKGAAASPSNSITASVLPTPQKADPDLKKPGLTGQSKNELDPTDGFGERQKHDDPQGGLGERNPRSVKRPGLPAVGPEGSNQQELPVGAKSHEPSAVSNISVISDTADSQDDQVVPEPANEEIASTLKRGLGQDDVENSNQPDDTVPENNDGNNDGIDAGGEEVDETEPPDNQEEGSDTDSDTDSSSDSSEIGDQDLSNADIPKIANLGRLQGGQEIVSSSEQDSAGHTPTLAQTNTPGLEGGLAENQGGAPQNDTSIHDTHRHDSLQSDADAPQGENSQDSSYSRSNSGGHADIPEPQTTLEAEHGGDLGQHGASLNVFVNTPAREADVFEAAAPTPRQPFGQQRQEPLPPQPTQSTRSTGSEETHSQAPQATLHQPQPVLQEPSRTSELTNVNRRLIEQDQELQRLRQIIDQLTENLQLLSRVPSRPLDTFTAMAPISLSKGRVQSLLISARSTQRLINRTFGPRQDVDDPVRVLGELRAQVIQLEQRLGDEQIQAALNPELSDARILNAGVVEAYVLLNQAQSLFDEVQRFAQEASFEALEVGGNSVTRGATAQDVQFTMRSSGDPDAQDGPVSGAMPQNNRGGPGQIDRDAGLPAQLAEPGNDTRAAGSNEAFYPPEIPAPGANTSAEPQHTGPENSDPRWTVEGPPADTNGRADAQHPPVSPQRSRSSTSSDDARPPAGSRTQNTGTDTLRQRGLNAANTDSAPPSVAGSSRRNSGVDPSTTGTGSGNPPASPQSQSERPRTPSVAAALNSGSPASAAQTTSTPANSAQPESTPANATPATTTQEPEPSVVETLRRLMRETMESFDQFFAAFRRVAQELQTAVSFQPDTSQRGNTAQRTTGTNRAGGNNSSATFRTTSNENSAGPEEPEGLGPAIVQNVPIPAFNPRPWWDGDVVRRLREWGELLGSAPGDSSGMANPAQPPRATPRSGTER